MRRVGYQTFREAASLLMLGRSLRSPERHVRHGHTRTDALTNALSLQVRCFQRRDRLPAFPDPGVPIPTKENETRPGLEERRRASSCKHMRRGRGPGGRGSS